MTRPIRSRSRVKIAASVTAVALAVVAGATGSGNNDRVAPTSVGSLTVLSTTASSVALGWAASTDRVGVVGYGVYVDRTLLASEIHVLSYTVEGLACGTTYTLGVDAYNAVGRRSKLSETTTATAPCSKEPVTPSSASVAAPTGLAVAAVSDTNATLTWAPVSGTGIHYDIFVGGVKSATVSVPPSTVAGLTCGTAYSLGVEAFDTSGVRSARTTISATTSACTPPPPPSGAAPAASSPDLFVAATGSDGNACTSQAPCASWNRAYQVARAGQTILVGSGGYGMQVIQQRQDLRGGSCSLSDESRCVKFVMGGPVSISNIEVRGSGVKIDGGNQLNVAGIVKTEANSISDFPDHVVFVNLQTGNFGVYSATDVTFKNSDIGPSTQSTGCKRYENKIGYGFGIEVVPTNILLDGLRIHDQNGDIGRLNGPGDADDCHYGGLFLVTANGLIVRNTVFERNVVYHVQLQNFGGAPPVRNVLFENNSFGCPVDWLDKGAGCTGQKAIQFDYDPGIEVRLLGNVAANGKSWDGSSGLFGCYVGTCGGLAGLAAVGNVDLARVTEAPPLLSAAPPR